jgi:hypothetical protein
MIQLFIPKDIEGMPDSYGVEITLLGSKPFIIEIVQHRIIDKIFEQGKFITAHYAPFWEFNLKENNELLCIPVSNCMVKFDNRWFKICQLAKEYADKANKGS